MAKLQLKNIMMYGVFLQAFTCGVFAQESALWRTVNPVTPTTVPAYGGQPSPFPKIQVTKANNEDPSQTEANLKAEETLRQARKLATQKVRGLIDNFAKAFRPDPSGIEINGVTKGQAGSRVLIENAWVGVGQELDIPLVTNPELTSAIDSLRIYDIDTARAFAEDVGARLAKTPTIKMRVDSISDKSMTIKGKNLSIDVPIRSL